MDMDNFIIAHDCGSYSATDSHNTLYTTKNGPGLGGDSRGSCMCGLHVVYRSAHRMSLTGLVSDTDCVSCDSHGVADSLVGLWATTL